MGLIQGDSSYRLTTRLSAWSLPGAVIGAAALLALLGDFGRHWLSYDRDAIAAGQLWRLLSGHFVHLGWSHFVMNAIGLLLICYLVAARFTARNWLILALVTIAGIDLAFWLLEPQLEWYVGLSGLLHGLLAAGVVAGFRLGLRDSWLLGFILAGKLAWEQFVGPVPGSVESTGGNVIVAAHFYGAVVAAVSALLIPVRVKQ